MSLVCPFHEDLKPGDRTMCEMKVCALENSCPYKNMDTKKESGTPLIFCQDFNGNFHKPIYYPMGGDYECPMCQLMKYGEARGRIQAKFREKLREKIATLENIPSEVKYLRQQNRDLGVALVGTHDTIEQLENDLQNERQERINDPSRTENLIKIYKNFDRDKEIKRLKEVVLMNHEEMEGLREYIKKDDRVIFELHKELRDERARRNQVEAALRGVKNDLDEVVERHTTR